MILLLGLALFGTDLAQAQSKINSNCKVVQVGVITCSYRDIELE